METSTTAAQPTALFIVSGNPNVGDFRLLMASLATALGARAESEALPHAEVVKMWLDQSDGGGLVHARLDIGSGLRVACQALSDDQLHTVHIHVRAR